MFSPVQPHHHASEFGGLVLSLPNPYLPVCDVLLVLVLIEFFAETKDKCRSLQVYIEMELTDEFCISQETPGDITTGDRFSPKVKVFPFTFKPVKLFEFQKWRDYGDFKRVSSFD
ncbi:hypothetical protein Tco_0162822 [Tanacetum coccineum]